MAEQWIDAATAKQLVTVPPIGTSGVEALIERAHAGLVKTRARLLIKGDQRAEGVAVPPEVWVTGQSGKLGQAWVTGDFSVRVDGSEDGHWQAFGVTFALSGVLEMLPAERRPMAAHSLSVASNPAWMTARAARRFAYEKAGVSINGAEETVLDQARLGFVTGRAVLAQRFEAGRVGGSARWDKAPRWEAREWDVPSSFWREFTKGTNGLRNWERGIFGGPFFGPHGHCLMRLESVHFLAESLRTLLPATEHSPPEASLPVETAAKDAPGGRPPAAWWDDMWCDVWGLIYEGKLIPQTQAEVEAAMHTWAQDHGHNPAESTIRPKARKLFKVFSDGVENSPAS